MNISEVFYSIQGEGMHLGVPSVFIRTSGCNLRCHWCDTPYTSWHPERNLMTIAEIIEKVRELHKDTHSMPHIVITGGEPFVQFRLPELVAKLKEKKYFITVETNGTIYRETEADFISLSPKLSNSVPKGEWGLRHEIRRINLEVIFQFITNHSFQLKFVIEKNSDVSEVLELIQRLQEKGLSIKADQIILMPQGRNRKEVMDKYTNLVDTCLEYGFRISPRLHIDIWGEKRGH